MLAVSGQTWAEEDQSSIEKAREALSKQDEDTDSAKQLEEVFTAAEKNFSLLPRNHYSVNYSFDYSFTGDQALDIDIVGNSIRNFDVTPTATHTFTNSFTIDYGLRNNLTLSTRLPLVSRIDTQDDRTLTSIGDVSVSLRWQPFPIVPGRISTTVFSTFTTKTGESPYEIDVNEELSSGSGVFSLAGGVSLSKVLDPVVIFGSGSFTFNFDETGLNQVRGARLLTEVDPGFTVSYSSGFAYALSYDVSLSASFQLSYTDEFELLFSDGTTAVAQDQISALINVALGIRTSEKTIVNYNVGFGLTEDSPDVLVGISFPLSFSGLKASVAELIN